MRGFKHSDEKERLFMLESKIFTYKSLEQQLNKVVEIVLVMVMEMDRKMLSLDKQPLVYQF
jgi:hypothetical protein